MKRQVGTTESGDPIFNEYAVCRDWQKQSQSIKLKAKSLSDLLNHPYPRRVQQKKAQLPKSLQSKDLLPALTLKK